MILSARIAITIGLFAAGCVLGPWAGFAESIDGYRQTYATCLVQSKNLPARLIICDATERDYQFRRIEGAFRVLMSELQPRDRDRLMRDRHRATEAADRFCAHQPDDGLNADIARSGCLLEQTRRQATQMETLRRNWARRARSRV